MRALARRAPPLLGAILALTLVAVIADDANGGPLDPFGSPTSTRPLAEPRTPISQIPFTADAPGSYFLTKQLTATALFQDGITVTANDVTIDLNGFTLRGFLATGLGINVPNPQRNLVVKNGGIESFRQAVAAANAYSSRFEGLTVRLLGDPFGAGVEVGASSIVQDCILDGGGVTSDGITLGVRSVLRRCSVVRHPGFGVQASTYAVIEGNQIVNNASSGPSYFGILVMDNDVTVRDNYLDNNAVRDIQIAVGKRAIIIDNALASCESIAFGGGFTFAPIRGERHSNITHTAGYCP